MATKEHLKINGPMEKTPEIAEFQEREWPFANKEHFGGEIDWKRDTFYMEGREEETLVVIAKCEVLGGVFEIDQLIVDHERYQQGIGSKMIARLEEIARERGCHKLWLLTGEKWRAVEFYEKHGFTTAAELPNHYLNENWRYMEKSLS